MIHPFIWSRAYTPFKCSLDHHGARRLSIAYFCPACGEIWARLVSTESQTWGTFARRCDRCPPTQFDFERAGSLLSDFDPYLFSALPPDLLRREVLLLKE